jgi:hypothetical protein
MGDKIVKINRTIHELILNGELKTEWSELEKVSVIEILESYFAEELGYRTLDTCTENVSGVTTEALCKDDYYGIEYDGDIFENAYLTIENDIILTGKYIGEVYIFKTSEEINEEGVLYNTVDDLIDSLINDIKLSKELKNIQQLKKRMMIALKEAEIRELELEMNAGA